MTESEWMATDDLHAALDWLIGKTFEDWRPDPAALRRFEGRLRKIRLFACAWCRTAWHSLTGDAYRAAVEAVERLDGVVPAEGMGELSDTLAFRAGRALWDFGNNHYTPAEVKAKDFKEAFAPDRLAGHLGVREGSIGELVSLSRECAWDEGRPALRALLRDVFGPLLRRPPQLDPAWQMPMVLSLATTAYDNRTLPAGELDPDRLAVLSDALEEAGCDDADILNHLRSPGPHVRGCWVVDLLTGRN